MKRDKEAVYQVEHKQDVAFSMPSTDRSASAPVKRSGVWTLLKIALAIILTVYVLSQTSLSDVVALSRRVSWAWLLASFVAFGATTWFSTRRYWILIGRQVVFPQLLSLVILQNAISNFVASGAGAVSYVAMLRSEHRVRVSQGITSLLLAKVGDLLAVGLALALSSGVVRGRIAALWGLVIVLVALIAGGLLTFVLVILLRQKFVAAVRWLLHRLSLTRLPFCDRALNLLSALAEQDARGLYPLLAPVMGYSCLMLILTFVGAYWLVQAFAVPIDVAPIVFMVSLTQLMAIIPIQVFGGLGVYDVTVMYLYGLFGISQSDIAPFIVEARIIFYAYNLLLLLYVPLAARLNREPRA